MHPGAERRPPSSLPPARRWFLLVCGGLLIAVDLLRPSGLISPETLALDIQLVLGLGAITLAIADRQAEDTRVRLLARAAALVFALALAGATVESATRWVFRDVTVAADSRSFFSRSIVDIHLNDRGFRERSVTDAKPPGTYRIAVLGDSLTFGNGLEPHERYSNLLDARLPDDFEVLNFGIPGDNTPQHLDVLKTRAMATHPDFVLLQWFVNDIEGDDVSNRPAAWPLVPHPDAHRWLNRHSAFYSLANMRWTELQVALGLVPSYADYLRTRAADPNGADANRDARLLREMIAVTRRSGAGFGIVLFPDPGQDLGPAYPFGFLHDRVLEICRDAGVTCVDLREAFARVHDRRSLWVSPFDHHPSARANEMAAIRLLEAFGQEWFRR